MNLLIKSLLLILFTGCSTQKVPSNPLELGKYNFAYRVDEQNDLGIVQAFDDQERTYVQFLRPELAQRGIFVLNSDGRVIVHKRKVQVISVDGVHGTLLVMGKDGSSLIENVTPLYRTTGLPTVSVEARSIHEALHYE
jgi:hypothetical protein